MQQVSDLSPSQLSSTNKPAHTMGKNWRNDVPLDICPLTNTPVHDRVTKEGKANDANGKGCEGMAMVHNGGASLT